MILPVVWKVDAGVRSVAQDTLTKIVGAIQISAWRL